MSLYERIRRRFGPSSMEAAKAFFEAARLPEPDDGEHFTTYDSGEILFLNDEGCTLRFSAASSSSHAHPRALQPLGSRMLGDMRLDFLPGGKCMPAEQAFEEMAGELETDGYHFAPDDREPRNGIELPDGTVLLVDPGAVKKLSRGVTVTGEALYARQRIFDPLRAAFARCWPEDEDGIPAPEKLAEFLKTCREAREKGTLTAGWKTLTSRDFGASRKIKEAASNYQRHRQHYERYGPD